MKKTRNYSWIPYVLLLGVLGILVFLNVFCLEHWLDSDMAAEMIFSKQLAEEGKFLTSSEWYYSSEFRVLYTQILMVPLFKLCSSWHLIRSITNIVFYLLMLGSYFYMIKPLKIKKTWVALTSIILVLPFSETLMTHMQMGNTYMSHVIIIFFSFGMFLRLSMKEDKSKLYRLCLTAVYVLLSIVCGMSGVRYMLALYCPLVITAFVLLVRSREFLVLRKEISWANAKMFFKQKGMTYFTYSILGAVMVVIGYGINIVWIAKNYSFQTYDTIEFIGIYKGIFLERVQNTFGSLMMLLGYISNKSVLSLRGLITMISFVLIALGVFVVKRSGALLKDEELKNDGMLNRRFVQDFFVVSFLLNTFVFLFTTSTIVDRYYITTLIFILPLLASFFDMEKLAFDKIVIGVIFVGCMLLATSKVVYSLMTVDKNQDKVGVLTFLEENDYDFGYATYWNANIMTELSNGEVELANIINPESMEYFKWSSPKKYYEANYEGKASFILLTAAEMDLYQDSEKIKDAELLYQDSYYTVLEYEN